MRAILAVACLSLALPAAAQPPGSGLDPAFEAELKEALRVAFAQPVTTKAAEPGWAAATCQVMRPTGGGRADAGSGTCIACDGTRSLILSNNHIFSDQPYPNAPHPPARVPVRALVTPRGEGQRYPAVCVAADANADLALVIADVVMPVADLSDSDAPVGATVAHLGMGSGGGTGRVIRPPPTTDLSSAFASTTPSISGDSGAGLFDPTGRLVAVNCGRHGPALSDPQRGTPVSAVRVLIATRPERSGPIARLRDRITGKATVAAPAVPVSPVVVSIDARLSAIEARLSALEARRPEAAPLIGGTAIVPGPGACPAPVYPRAEYAPAYAPPACAPQPRGKCRLIGGCR